jgi:hypothetical protein
MEGERYPGQAEHVRAHLACTDSLDRALRAYDATGVSPHFLDVIERVARWLDVHLRSEDLRLGRFQAAQSGRSRSPAAPAPGGAGVTPASPERDPEGASGTA